MARLSRQFPPLPAFQPHHSDDVQEIRDLLAAALPDLAVELLGKTPKRRGREVRFGRGESFSVKNGGWYDFESQTGGDALALIQDRLGLDFPGALAWARSWLGLGGEATRIVRRPQAQPKAVNDNRLDEDAAVQMRWAASLWKAASSLTRTLAEVYLREVRGIPAESVERLVELDLARFSPAFRSRYENTVSYYAVLFRLTDSNGDRALQAVKLKPDGSKLVEDGLSSKLNVGPVGGAAFRLPGVGRLLIAEGPEEAAILWAATGRPVVASMGGMAKLLAAMVAGDVVTVAAQNKAPDQPGKPARTSLDEAVAKALARGVDVGVVTSPPGDWNDMLVAGGVEAVVAALVSPVDTVEVAQPEVPVERIAVGEALTPVERPKGIPADEARAIVADLIRRFVGDMQSTSKDLAEWSALATAIGCEGKFITVSKSEQDFVNGKLSEAGMKPLHYGDLFFWERPRPRVLTINAAMGIGKSRSVLTDLVAPLLESNPNAKVIVFAPDKALARKATDEAVEAGFNAVFISGRDDDTCDAMEDVELTATAIMPVQKRACHNVVNGVEHKCKYYDSCAYQLQRESAKRANVIFMAHAYLFLEQPEFIGKVDAVIIDETFYSAALLKTGSKSSKGKEVKNEYPFVTSGGFSAAKLWPTQTKFAHVVERIGVSGLLRWQSVMAGLSNLSEVDGNPTAEDVEASGLTIEGVGEARAMVWRFKLGADMVPGMCRKERKKENGRVGEHNRRVSRIATVLEIVERHFHGDGDKIGELLGCVVDEDCDGGDIHGLRILTHRDIHADWVVPTICLDGTARWEFVSPTFDTATRYEAHAFVELPVVDAPHERIAQLLNAPTVAGDLITTGRMRPKDRRTVKNNQKSIADFVRIMSGKETLVIGQKGFIEQASERELLPKNRGWFGAIRGRNDWKNADTGFIVGRTLPWPDQMEDAAAAITRQPVQRLPAGEFYPFTMENGVRRYFHPDPRVEAVRWRTCEGEVLQAIARLRGINRTADLPATIYVLNDLPIAVDFVGRWQKPTSGDLMWAEGVVFSSPKSAHNAYGDMLWTTYEAAKSDFRRGGGQTPIVSLYRRLTPTSDLVEVRFQLAGAGRVAETARFNPARIADPRAWLESRLGPLAKFEVVAAPEVEAQPATVAQPEALPVAREPLALPVVTVREYRFYQPGEADPLAEV